MLLYFYKPVSSILDTEDVEYSVPLNNEAVNVWRRVYKEQLLNQLHLCILVDYIRRQTFK